MMFFIGLKKCLAGLMALVLAGAIVSLPARAEEDCASLGFSCIKFRVNWKTATAADVWWVDVNASDKEGKTPLMSAATWSDDPEVIRALLEAGADVNARNRYESTALMYASEPWVHPYYPNLYPKPNPEIVRLLVDAGADVNARDNEGKTALMMAENPEITRILLEAGADVNARTDRGRFLRETFLHLKRAGPYTEKRWTPLMYAATGDVERVRLLLEADADVNARAQYWRYTALMRAAGNENPEVVRALLAAGAKVNAKDRRGRNALMNAVHNKNPEVVRALLAAGADVNVCAKDGSAAIMRADNPEVIRMLLAAGANASAGGRAIMRVDNPDAVRLLVEAGANVNARDKDGDTALMWAVILENLPVAKVLLEAGADVNARDDDGETALMEALGRDDSIALALIAAGADVHARDDKGQTALIHEARGAKVGFGNPDMALALLEAGADINARDHDGRTALMHVAMGYEGWNDGRIKAEPREIERASSMILTLLKAGADAAVIDKNGKTAWDMMRHNRALRGSAAYYKLKALQE